MISSDGHNQTLKYLELYYNFPAKYRESINVTENFSVTVLHNNSPVTYEVKGARFKDIATDWFLKPKEYRRKLEFTMLDNTGLLTLHSFDEPDVKEGGQIFDKYIDSVFHQLNTKGVTDLIIDLRNNDGGEDSHAAYLTRHFFDAPFRYWDRIEVTEGFARSFNKKNFVELNAPIQKDTAWILPKAKKTTEFDFYETQQPAKENYKGKVYVLINGFCESSCADIAAILSYNKKAIMIGEETGGGFQGNNSGITPEGVKVMPMNFPLDVPLQKYFNYVDPKLNVARGVMPDYPVELSVEELIKGEDKVLEVVLEMIRKQTK